MAIILQKAVTTCPLCGGNDSTRFDQRILLGYQLTNRLCPACGLVFLSPRMSTDQLNTFYAENYRELYHNAKEPTPVDLSIQTRRANHLLDSVFAHGLTMLDAHLDIGCSTGTLLNTFKNRFNNRAVGIELDNAHRAYAQSHGITAFASLTDLPAEFEKAFNLVSLIHVLEHLTDPVGTLVELRTRWMRPGGWLLLETPNLYCHDSFEVAHLVSFSPATLTQTVLQAGFQPVFMARHGQPRSDLLPLYLTLLAKPVTDPGAGRTPVHAESGVKFKRQAGVAYRRLLTRLLPGKTWKAG